MPQFVRQTAVPCTIAEILSGEWVQNAGLEPSGIRTSLCLVSRANILGVIVEKDGDAVTIDDSSGTINVRSFEAKPVPIYAEIGDIVMVIGRPREYNGSRYLVLEICKKVRNATWIQYRKKELAMRNPGSMPAPAMERPKVMEQVVEQIVVQQKNPFEAIIEKIRELDQGTGADIEDILPAIPEAEKFLRTLIEEGEVFEIRPGRLKVLE